MHVRAAVAFIAIEAHKQGPRLIVGTLFHSNSHCEHRMQLCMNRMFKVETEQACDYGSLAIHKVHRAFGAAIDILVEQAPPWCAEVIYDLGSIEFWFERGARRGKPIAIRWNKIPAVVIITGKKAS